MTLRLAGQPFWLNSNKGSFDWSGEHLHRFLIHGTAYGISYLGGIGFLEDARQVPLSRFRLHCGERFRYEYDFMADWKLDIRLERALLFDPDRALPSCIGGSRAAPPEDCVGASEAHSSKTGSSRKFLVRKLRR
jgi:hypothetical protein